MGEPKKEEGSKQNGSIKPILVWESPEFVHYEKGLLWFTAVGLAAAAIGGTFYWIKLTSGALVVITAAVVFMASSGLRPKTIKCALYEDGVVIDGKPYRFEQFKSFWFCGVDLIKAKLKLVGKMAGEIAMPLKNIDAEEVRSFLKKRLPEETGKAEGFSETINRWIRF